MAAVIYNRLEQGIPLGIDATIRFATGNWTDPLTQSELRPTLPTTRATTRACRRGRSATRGWRR